MVRLVRPSLLRLHSTFGRALAVVLAVFCAGLLTLPRPASAAPPDKVPGEVLIKFKDTASISDIREVMDELGATRVRRFKKIRAEQHRITKLSVEDAVHRFRKHRAVEIIEPNWIVQADDVPNDPQFDLLWGLRNTGQTGGLVGADIDAVPAWDVQTGSRDVVVAVIDTGTDFDHPDLAANIWTNTGEIPLNLIDDDENGFVDDVHGYDFHNEDGDPMDDNGHGTHVSGTIGAVGNNGVGLTGVARNVRIMALKFLGGSGNGATSDAVECVEYAIQMGAHVMNASWGGSNFSALLLLAIQNANAAGIPFVAAAGNSGISLDTFRHYPASYAVPNVIAVASTTHHDILSTFSNFGATTVHLAAPGSSIWSTLPGGSYGHISGTSMATPHVSGAIALLRSEFPNMAAAQIKTTVLSSVDVLPSLTGFVTTGGRLNVARMLEGLDSIPPAAITSLAVHDAESNRIILRWTATGDDGSQGQASRYDLRYALTPITEGSFASAQQVGSVAAPRPAGSPEEVTVPGLQAETDYFFAVKVLDEYGNVSPLSNVASGHTVGPPDIAVTPLAVQQSLLTGQQGERVITVTNNGEEGTLEFAALGASPAPSATVQPDMVLGKGDADPREGDPVVDGRGGPDQFGHQWIDSDETGGPQFQWIDISGVGTPIAITGDDVISNFVEIGFLFPFYDNLYAHVRVSTNGFLTFSSGVPEYTNQFLPSPIAPENMVAPLWDDLAFTAASTAHAWSDGQRFIVQWSNVSRFGGGGPYTFQAILHADGTIVYQYLFVGAPSNSATVGIQNATRSDGLTIAFNTGYLKSEFAVRIQASPTWLTVTPSSGRVEPGQSLPLTVRFDASHLTGGQYGAVVRLTSNDPDEPQTDVAATLTVAAAPDIAFGFASVSFLNVFVGGSQTQRLLVTNTGVLPLEITDVRASPSVFEVDDIPVSLAPGGSYEIEIRFRPSAVGTVPGVLTLFTNDPDEEVATIPLSGTAVLPPDVSVTPSSLTASIFTGEVTTREVSIANTGPTVLTWSAFAQGASASALQTFQLAPPSPQGSAPDGPMAARDPAHARTAAIEALLANLTGVRVLFDNAHDNEILGEWSGLVGSLTQRGATIDVATEPITPEILTAHDILWIPDSFNPWQPSEIAALTPWLAGGGALLLEGDNPTTVAIYNSLLAAAGVAIRYQEYPGASGITDRVYPHVITRDVELVNLDSNLASVTEIVPPSVVLLEDVAGVPAAVAVTVGAGRILALSDEMFSDAHSVFGDNQLLANQAFDWLSGLSWLQVAPAQGTTPGGGTSTVTVTLDGLGLAGGDHTAQVIVASDDPDEAEIAIPVSLHVTGAPDIALARNAASFGPVFITGSRADTIRVTNTGTAALVVESAEIGDPQFHADAATFELGVGQSRSLIITFAPTRLGPVETTATLRSNDPDEAVVTIALTGEGREPPDAHVEPDSLSEGPLATGQTANQVLRIQNVSGSDLEFRVEVADPEASENPPPASGAGPDPATTMTWSEFRVRAGEPSGPTVDTPAIPFAELPVVLRDPGGDGGSADLTELRASSQGGQLQVEMRFGSPLQPANFGGFLSLDVDQNRTTGKLPSLGRPGQDIGMEFELEFFTLPFGVVTLYDRVLGTFVANIPVTVTSSTLQFTFPLALLGNDDGRIDVTGVIGNVSGPTDWFPDEGHGVIGGPIWLAAEPASGVLPAGSGADISIRFNAAALDGGTYDARVVVESNDPDEPRISIPVRLAVTSAPVFAVQPTSLDFGTTFLGTHRDTSLTVFNIGSLPLTVLGIAADDLSYTFDPVSFQIAPLTSRVVHVRFAPAGAGPHEATLEITHDAAGSPSPVTLAGTGAVPPVLTASPRSFDFTIESGDVETQTLALGNAGGSDLVFDFDAMTTESTVEVRESMEIPRGSPDPRQGEPVTEGSGGPDGFGYRWTDSDEPGGPVFDWVEISQIGTRLPMRLQDDNFGPVPIGFGFPFYGNQFTTFQICTHGWLSFTNETFQFTNQPLPSLGAPENLLAVFWEDLDFGNVERAYVHNDGTRLIIQWNDVPRTNGGGRYTFQAILYPNGTILYQYLTITGAVTSATVGIQNGGRNDGLQVVFNAPYLRERMAIRFSPVPSWLRIEPPSGTLTPGASQEVSITGSARGVFPGSYPARLRLTSNDPVTPELTIPVSFLVTGTPDITTSPAALEFDTLFVGTPTTRDLRITNVGTNRLEVTQVLASRPGITVSPATLALGPLQSAVMRVTFLPTAAGDLGGALTIVSNDPDSPTILPITGIALVPPRVVVEPLPIIAVAAPGGAGVKTIRIRNTGGSDLRWNAGPPIAASLPEVNHIELEKGAEDGRPGILGTGGPDRFGHHWIDSDHAGGPVFEWVDISQVGVRVPFTPEADDQNRGPFPIGFTFPFYNRAFSQFRVCTNGWMSFSNTSTSFANQPLPSLASSSPENLIAPFWSDLVLAPDGAVYYHSEAGRLIVQWTNLKPFGSGAQERFTFQAVLFQSGEIALRYQSVTPFSFEGTVGVQNGARNDGLTMAFNTPYLHPELSILVFEKAAWVSVDPASGVIPAGGSAEVSLAIDASDLEAGEHRARLPLASNDPALRVLGAPVIARVASVDAAATEVDPNTLNLQSSGKWVMGRVELPAPYVPSQIVPSTVRWNGVVPLAEGTTPQIGDFNANGVPDVTLRFDRAAVEAILPEGDPIPVTLTGEILETAAFTARDEIRVKRPHLKAPNGGELLPAGSGFAIQWIEPQGSKVERADLVVSFDGGETWQMLAENIRGTSYGWTVPHTPTTRAWIRVHLYDALGAMGYDRTDAAFTIQPTVSAVETEAGAPPTEYAFHQNAPNPFNPVTWIRFDLPRAGRVSLRVYAVDGRLVREWREMLPAGRHRVRWDGKTSEGNGVASGVYFAKLRVEGEDPFEASRRMMVVK